MRTLTTTRILFQPEHRTQQPIAKPWLWPLPRLDGMDPYILSSSAPSQDAPPIQIGYRERSASPEIVPVFAPADGAITYAACSSLAGTLCIDHAGGWSTSYTGLEIVLARTRDRCSGRRRPRVRAGDVLGYLRSSLILDFGLDRWVDGAWTAIDAADQVRTWGVQPWFTGPSMRATSELAV